MQENGEEVAFNAQDGVIEVLNNKAIILLEKVIEINGNHEETQSDAEEAKDPPGCAGEPAQCFRYDVIEVTAAFGEIEVFERDHFWCIFHSGDRKGLTPV